MANGQDRLGLATQNTIYQRLLQSLHHPPTFIAENVAISSYFVQACFGELHEYWTEF